jgi:hypothetical protein
MILNPMCTESPHKKYQKMKSGSVALLRSCGRLTRLSGPSYAYGGPMRYYHASVSLSAPKGKGGKDKKGASKGDDDEASADLPDLSGVRSMCVWNPFCSVLMFLMCI